MSRCKAGAGPHGVTGDCVFPFTFGGIKYENCNTPFVPWNVINEYKGKSLCMTGIEPNTDLGTNIPPSWAECASKECIPGGTTPVSSGGGGGTPPCPGKIDKNLEGPHPAPPGDRHNATCANDWNHGGASFQGCSIFTPWGAVADGHPICPPTGNTTLAGGWGYCKCEAPSGGGTLPPPPPPPSPCTDKNATNWNPTAQGNNTSSCQYNNEDPCLPGKAGPGGNNVEGQTCLFPFLFGGKVYDGSPNDPEFSRCS